MPSIGNYLVKLLRCSSSPPSIAFGQRISTQGRWRSLGRIPPLDRRMKWLPGRGQWVQLVKGSENHISAHGEPGQTARICARGCCESPLLVLRDPGSLGRCDRRLVLPIQDRTQSPPLVPLAGACSPGLSFFEPALLPGPVSERLERQGSSISNAAIMGRWSEASPQPGEVST
jgi:hypothetical protein